MKARNVTLKFMANGRKALELDVDQAGKVVAQRPDTDPRLRHSWIKRDALKAGEAVFVSSPIIGRLPIRYPLAAIKPFTRKVAA